MGVLCIIHPPPLSSESQLQQMLEESIEDNTCILDGSIFKAENLVGPKLPTTLESI